MSTTQTKEELERNLENKYAAVISQAKQLGAKIEKSHVDNNKLVLRVAVPSDQAKNKIWDEVKTIDPVFSDLSLEVHVEAGGASGQRTYTVQRGDTLSALAQRYYGNATQYNKIFDANRDQLKDPDKIQVGQTLKIPE